MGRKTLKFDYRVEVYPTTDVFGVETSESEEAACERVKAAIDRQVSNVNLTKIVHSEDEVCEFCHDIWEETPGSRHNGGCCDEDIAKKGEADV